MLPNKFPILLIKTKNREWEHKSREGKAGESREKEGKGGKNMGYAEK